MNVLLKNIYKKSWIFLFVIFFCLFYSIYTSGTSVDTSKTNSDKSNKTVFENRISELDNNKTNTLKEEHKTLSVEDTKEVSKNNISSTDLESFFNGKKEITNSSFYPEKLKKDKEGNYSFELKTPITSSVSTYKWFSTSSNKHINISGVHYDKDVTKPEVRVKKIDLVSSDNKFNYDFEIYLPINYNLESDK